MPELTKEQYIKDCLSAGACLTDEEITYVKERDFPAVLKSDEFGNLGYALWAVTNLDEKWLPLLQPTPEQFERGITHEDWTIVANWVRRTDIRPTAEQLERGLTSTNWLIRSLWVQRRDIIPAPEQYDRVLADRQGKVRAAGANRTDIIPTPAQYERGLTDTSGEVRASWANRTDLTPTPEQYERGLTDEYCLARLAWANRTDLTPTPEQYDRGIRDSFTRVRLGWARRRDLTPSDEQLAYGLADDDPEVVAAWEYRVADPWAFIAKTLDTMRDTIDAFDAVCDPIQLAPESPIREAIYTMQNTLIAALERLCGDTMGNIQWYVLDCDFGRDAHKGGIPGDMRKIDSVVRLRWLCELTSSTNR